jgi:arsenate reductase
MAEGFARKYGSDVVNAWSAGLAPAAIVQPLTIQVMSQKNVDIQDQFPKSVNELELNAFDVIFNMSGMALPAHVRCEVRVWNVIDPMTQAEEVYLQVRDQIEGLVLMYILQSRRAGRQPVAAAGARQTHAIAPRPPMSNRASVANGVPLPNAKNAAAEPADRGQTGHSSQRFRFGRVRKSRD